MLHAAQHVAVVAGVNIEIIEGFNLIAVLKVVLAMIWSMVLQNYELLAFMLGKLAFQTQLLFGEIERLADRCLGIYAGQVKELHKLLARLVQNGIFVSDADHVGSSSL